MAVGEFDKGVASPGVDVRVWPGLLLVNHPRLVRETICPMIRLTTLAVLLVSACGSSSNSSTDQQAASVFFDVYAQLETAQQAALAALPVAPVVQTIDFTSACAGGGAAVMHGTYDGDGSTNATYTLTTTLTGCNTGDATIDGTTDWVGTTSGTDTSPVFTEVLNGSVSFVGAIYAGTFTFHDITITVAVTNSSATVTVSGSVTLGSTTFTVDSSNWAGYFGG